MAIAAAAAQEDPGPGSERGVRVKIVCSHCDRVFVRHTRKGYTAKCPDCGTVNAGPALLAEQTKPKEAAARRRTRRRGARAERAAAGNDGAGAPPSPAPSAAAPVRRKRSAPPTTESQPGSEATGAGDAPRGRPAVGAPPASSPRRGFFDRIMGYNDGAGEDDDGG